MVAGDKRPTKYLSNFMDILLKPLLSKIKTYVNDDFDFLKKFKYARICKNDFSVNNGKYIEENWCRFLDDCYIALDTTNINFLKVFDILNICDSTFVLSKHQGIYFTFKKVK